MVEVKNSVLISQHVYGKAVLQVLVMQLMDYRKV